MKTNHELPTKVRARAGAGFKKDAECCIKVVVVRPKLFLFDSSFRGDIVGADNQIDTAVEEANIEVFNSKVYFRNP